MTTTRNILTLIIGLTFLACNNSATDNKSVSTPSDTIKTVSVDSFYIDENEVTSDYKIYDEEIKETEIVVKNKSDYSEKFIQGLKGLGYKKFELIDSLLIIDNKDTVTFSQTPKIGEQRVYTGKQGNLAIAVKVKRINYTTVDYKIEMVEFGKTNHFQTGQADIISSFFFGTESNEDERTGEGYFVTEYTDNREKNCYTHIRLGDENELAKIIMNCNGKIKDITLENFTTLHRK
jgi:hypothetical protein